MLEIFVLITTGMGLIIGFFIARFIKRQDSFRDEVRRDFLRVHYNAEANYDELKADLKRMNTVSMDRKARTKIKLLEDEMRETSDTFNQRLAHIKEDINRDHGTVVWLKEENEKNDKTLRKIYNKIVLGKA